MFTFPVITSQLDSLNIGTSLNWDKQIKLERIVFGGDAERIVKERESMTSPVQEVKPAGKKMGVWVDGKLRLQSRDRDAIEEYASRRMREKHNVWIAPVGSFVDVPKGGE
jgi:DUF971 family protein